MDKKPKPLDLKIFNSILDKLKIKNEQFKIELKIFMAWYTTKKNYLKALIEQDSKRVNLNGEEIDIVTDFYREQAKVKLAEEVKRETKMQAYWEKKVLNDALKAREQLNNELKAAIDASTVRKEAVLENIVHNSNKPKLSLKKS